MDMYLTSDPKARVGKKKKPQTVWERKGKSTELAGHQSSFRFSDGLCLKKNKIENNRARYPTASWAVVAHIFNPNAWEAGGSL